MRQDTPGSCLPLIDKLTENELSYYNLTLNADFTTRLECVSRYSTSRRDNWIRGAENVLL